MYEELPMYDDPYANMQMDQGPYLPAYEPGFSWKDFFLGRPDPRSPYGRSGGFLQSFGDVGGATGGARHYGAQGAALAPTYSGIGLAGSKYYVNAPGKTVVPVGGMTTVVPFQSSQSQPMWGVPSGPPSGQDEPGQGGGGGFNNFLNLIQKYYGGGGGGGMGASGMGYGGGGGFGG